MKTIFRMIKTLYRKLANSYSGHRYDKYTIAEKFREQGAKIGKNCVLQINAIAAEPYLVEIGDNVSIASNVSLITHDGASEIFREEIPYLRYYGKIFIEDNCFIGANSMILAGVRIGRNSIVGAGSVVIADVKPGTVVMGNPAIPVSTTERYKKKCLDKWRELNLTQFEPLFEGKNRWEVQKIMESAEFHARLRELFKSVK